MNHLAENFLHIFSNLQRSTVWPLPKDLLPIRKRPYGFLLPALVSQLTCKAGPLSSATWLRHGMPWRELRNIFLSATGKSWGSVPVFLRNVFLLREGSFSSFLIWLCSCLPGHAGKTVQSRYSPALLCLVHFFMVTFSLWGLTPLPGSLSGHPSIWSINHFLSSSFKIFCGAYPMYSLIRLHFWLQV